MSEETSHQSMEDTMGTAVIIGICPTIGKERAN
jgi:hypothetical protein